MNDLISDFKIREALKSTKYLELWVIYSSRPRYIPIFIDNKLYFNIDMVENFFNFHHICFPYLTDIMG